MNRKKHSVLWDLLLVGLLTAFTTIIVPFVGLMPLLSASLDLRSGRWTATAVMSLLAVGGGYVFYGPLGLACGIAAAVVGIAVVVMYRRGVERTDGLLYTILGSELLVLFATFILTRIFGNLTDALMAEMADAMSYQPDLYRDALANLVVIFREGLAIYSPEYNAAVATYAQWDFAELVEAATPMLSNALALMIPTVIFSFGLIMGGGTWLAAGYSLKFALKARGEEPASPMSAESLPVDFSRWTLPRIVTMPLMLLYLATMLLPSTAPTWLLIASQIVTVAAQMTLAVQGAALIVFFLERRKVRVGGRWAWVVILGLLFPSAIFLAGAFDAAFRVRELMLQQEELIKEALRRQQEEAAKSPYRPHMHEEPKNDPDTVADSPYARQADPEDLIDETPADPESVQDEERKEE